MAIYDYISAGEASSRKADIYVTKLFEKLQWIAETGMTGLNRDHVIQGMNALIFEAHCIYFYHDDDKCVIARILHGRQDVALHEF